MKKLLLLSVAAFFLIFASHAYALNIFGYDSEWGIDITQTPVWDLTSDIPGMSQSVHDGDQNGDDRFDIEAMYAYMSGDILNFLVIQGLQPGGIGSALSRTT